MMTTDELFATVEELRVQMDGSYLPVIRFGRGAKTFVLLSGVSLCGLEGAGKGVAAAYADYCEDYTVYLFDRKKVLPAGYQVADMAEDVYRALCHFGVAQADVYGVSQGGMMGLCLALAHPELVHKLVLCSSQARAGCTLREVATVWQQLAAQADTVGLNRFFAERVYSPAYRAQFSEAFKAMEQQGSAEDCARFAVLAKACADFDVYDRLAEIHCPVLVLADVNDSVIDVSSSREIADQLGCPLYLYEDYSHAVFDESPDIKQRVLTFMRQAG